MRNCQNCDNLPQLSDQEHHMRIRKGEGICSLKLFLDKGKRYCDEWVNTTYDPLDGKEDEYVDSYEKI